MGNKARGASMVSSIVKIKTDNGLTGYGEVVYLFIISLFSFYRVPVPKAIWVLTINGKKAARKI